MSLERGARELVAGVVTSVVLVAALLLVAAPAVATHGGGHSWSDMTIDVDCRSVSVTSSRSITRVEVVFADGTTQVFSGLTGTSWTKSFDKDLRSATATSGSEIPSTISDTAGPCGSTTGTTGTTGTGTTGSTSQMAVDADCRSVTVTSSREITDVVVTFVDGTSQRFDSVGGTSWKKTFDKDVKSATATSGSLTSTSNAGPCETTTGGTTTGTTGTGTTGTPGTTATTGSTATTGTATTGGPTTGSTATTGAATTGGPTTTTGGQPDQVAGVLLDRPANNPTTGAAPAPAAVVRNPAPRPEPVASVNRSLAATGAPMLPLAVTGLGSIATGAAALASVRRRRSSDEMIDIARRLEGHVL